MEEMQAALDAYQTGDNSKRPHQRRDINGRTPPRRSPAVSNASKMEGKAGPKAAA